MRSRYATVRQAMVDRRIEAGAYAREWGVDLPEIADWVWPDAGDAAGDTASASTGGDNE